MDLIRDFLVKHKVSTDVQGDHTVYWMSAAVFAQLPIRRWKHNRPPDEARVAEIRQWIETSKRVDGIIYLAWINDELVCYESNHRREAIKGVDGVHNILVDMMWTATDTSLKEEFIRLNKAISVPELFVTDQAEVRVEDLLQYVDGFCRNYAALKSNSSRPHRPGFNRDTFMEDVYQLVKESGLGLDEIMRRIGALNRNLRARDTSKLSKTIVDKCERSGLWLFAWKPRLTVSDIQDLM